MVWGLRIRNVPGLKVLARTTVAFGVGGGWGASSVLGNLGDRSAQRPMSWRYFPNFQGCPAAASSYVGQKISRVDPNNFQRI